VRRNESDYRNLVLASSAIHATAVPLEKRGNATKLIRATRTDKNCAFEQKERKRNEISIIALIEYTDLLSNLFFFFSIVCVHRASKERQI